MVVEGEEDREREVALPTPSPWWVVAVGIGSWEKAGPSGWCTHHCWGPSACSHLEPVLKLPCSSSPALSVSVSLCAPSISPGPKPSHTYNMSLQFT